MFAIVRDGKVRVATDRGVSEPYSAAGSRGLAWLCRHPGLLRALLPLFQDTDPVLASGLAGATAAALAALAPALEGAAGQLAAAGADWSGDDRVSLATPCPVSGRDMPLSVHEDDGEPD